MEFSCYIARMVIQNGIAICHCYILQKTTNIIWNLLPLRNVPNLKYCHGFGSYFDTTLTRVNQVDLAQDTSGRQIQNGCVFIFVGHDHQDATSDVDHPIAQITFVVKIFTRCYHLIRGKG